MDRNGNNKSELKIKGNGCEKGVLFNFLSLAVSLRSTSFYIKKFHMALALR